MCGEIRRTRTRTNTHACGFDLARIQCICLAHKHQLENSRAKNRNMQRNPFRILPTVCAHSRKLECTLNAAEWRKEVEGPNGKDVVGSKSPLELWQSKQFTVSICYVCCSSHSQTSHNLCMQIFRFPSDVDSKKKVKDKSLRIAPNAVIAAIILMALLGRWMPQNLTYLCCAWFLCLFSIPNFWQRCLTNAGAFNTCQSCTQRSCCSHSAPASGAESNLLACFIQCKLVSLGRAIWNSNF